MSGYRRYGQLPQAKPLADGKGGASPYQLGYRFEVSIKGRLERRGYFVMRAAMSKGKADLLAVGPVLLERNVTALFIQCKRRGVIGSGEWNEVFDLATAHGGWPVCCMKLSEKTVGFFRLDARREHGKRGRPWSQFDPADLSIIPPA